MYKEERPFKLWGYSISHNSLLLRSEKQYDDVVYENSYLPNVTIDIEFWGVSRINLPSSLKNIIISEEVSSKPLNNGLKLYKINSDYYVIASGCVIGSSNWGADESRLQNPELNYDKVLTVGNNK